MQGRRAHNTLEAVANIAIYPGHDVDRLFAISKDGPTPYAPALGTPPHAWTLALRFKGDGLINGPGNFAIDAEGSLWVTDNYEPGDRTQSVCAGRKLLAKPNGAFFPGSPYVGGGLSGAGYGIIADPDGHIWVGNFGFQAPACVGTPDEARYNSVSGSSRMAPRCRRTSLAHRRARSVGRKARYRTGGAPSGSPIAATTASPCIPAAIRARPGTST